MIQLKIKVGILAEKIHSSSEFQSIFAIGEGLNPALDNLHCHYNSINHSAHTKISE